MEIKTGDLIACKYISSLYTILKHRMATFASFKSGDVLPVAVFVVNSLLLLIIVKK